MKIDLQNTQTLKLKLKWKVFTKVIMRPRKQAWVLNRHCLIKREAFNLSKDRMPN